MTDIDNIRFINNQVLLQDIMITMICLWNITIVHYNHNYYGLNAWSYIIEMLFLYQMIHLHNMIIEHKIRRRNLELNYILYYRYVPLFTLLRINKCAHFPNKKFRIQTLRGLLMQCANLLYFGSLLLYEYPRIGDSLECEIMDELFSLPTINDNYQDGICVAFINEECFHLQRY